MRLPTRTGVRLALLGASSAAFQTLFAQEFLAGFSGNEAVLASLLGPWFLLTALGAFLGRRGTARPGSLALVVGAYGPLAVATLAGARLVPRLFPAGSAPGAASALLWAALMLGPTCVVSGLAFACLAAERASASEAPYEGPDEGGRAYLAESLGAAAAGAALSLFFAGWAPPFVLASGLLVASACAAALGLPRRPAMAVAAVGLALASVLAAAPVDLLTTRAQMPHLEVRARRESTHGAIVVTGAPDATALFVDRWPIAEASERARAEELVLLPLGLHPHPDKVAIVGVPPVGTMELLTGLGAREVDLLVEDEVLLDVLAAEYPDFSGEPVRRLAVDPRRWLDAHRAAYDVVLLASQEPTSVQLNRVFTAEFFEVARSALREGGLVAVALRGHAAYASTETRRLNSSVRQTLAAVFAHTRVYPLETALYVASQGPLLAPVEASAAVSSTIEARGVRPSHLTSSMLQALLTAQRASDAERWAALPEAVNRDLRPTTYRLALDRTLAEFEDLGVGALGLLATALVVGGLLLLRPGEGARAVAVATSGGAGLASQLVVMLAYQVGTGALYREVGLILAGFMLGAALGAAVGARRGGWHRSEQHVSVPRALSGDGARRSPERASSSRSSRLVVGARSAVDRLRGAPLRLLLVFDVGQVALALALWATLPQLLHLHGALARAVVFAVAGLVGALPGAQFAAAARTGQVRAGALYAADLLGAAVAALVTFTLLVPALGLGGVLLAVAAVKSASAVFLLLPGRAVGGTPARPLFSGLVALALGIFVLLAVLPASEGPLYAFTFLLPYQGLIITALLVTALAGAEPPRVRAMLARWARQVERVRDRVGLSAGRLAYFALLLPVAAFPLARCYFKVPFVFCHVCPRQCVFGVLRPYAIPAAVVANLAGHRFCEHRCPLGSAQAACERLGGRRARRIAALWLPRAVITGFVALAYVLARAQRGEGVMGGPFFSFFFVNAYAPSAWVLAASVGLLLLSLVVRRPFCEALCPVGAMAQLGDRAQRAMAPRASAPAGAKEPEPEPEPVAEPKPVADRRVFVRRAAATVTAAALGTQAFRELVLRATEPGLAVGFRNDAPRELGRLSRPASFAEATGGLVRCSLCPHGCILGENDRGFCRTRVVKDGKLFTVAYGNLCAAHLDPIEKKPLYHYLPMTPILSVASGGCNLRCLNCQNWEISQSRPEDVAVHELLPTELVRTAVDRRIPALAYTYSEPLMMYEYVRDTAAAAREQGVKNVLVTAGYINERPLRELCRVLDAVTLDVKAFRDSFYKEVSAGRLSPVLRTLEVLKEERVWTEVSFLMVPSMSDLPAEIADFAKWVVTHLGRSTPFHLLRFHPAHRLEHLAPTAVPVMEEARRRSLDAGLQFVYLGNVPGHDANNTHCPRDGRVLIEREGFAVTRNELVHGRCPCGEPIAGVFET